MTFRASVAATVNPDREKDLATKSPWFEFAKRWEMQFRIEIKYACIVHVLLRGQRNLSMILYSLLFV